MGTARFLIGLAFAALAPAAGCHRATEQMPTRPISSAGAGFVGTIYIARTDMIEAVEESPTRSRRGEIWLSPATEITNRTGVLIPRESLRRGMRITVWFTNDFTETATDVQGRASRIIVDY